jgi:hypothetical protein
MSRAVDELRQIPFDYLIGAPLKAAIEAQGLAAKTTIDFIEKVGFIPEDPDQDPFFLDEEEDVEGGQVRNVTFSYSKTDENNVATNVTLTVPILSIVPIPYIRIDEITIDFTAKLNDTITNVTKTNFQLDSSTSGQYRAFWSPIRLDFRVSTSYQSSRETASRYTREYQMNINVRAVQDDLPAGMERVLDLLEQIIKERPAGSP